MPDTTHDSAAAWRDLSDQLTAEQIERLSGMEARSTSPADETAQALLAGARQWAEANLTGRVVFGHLATPAGARRLFPWEDEGDGRWSRRFEGTGRGIKQQTGRFVTRLDIDIEGVQHGDGRIERACFVYSSGAELTAVQARTAAADLLAAADELDRFDATAACRLCDADGWLWGAGEDGDPIACDHQADEMDRLR